MTDLIERLEKAEGGSRELDAGISEAIGIDWQHATGPGDGFWSHMPVSDWEELPHYTESIDVALTLVPEQWRWHRYKYLAGSREARRHYVSMCRTGAAAREQSVATAATPCLALTIAALKAREASDG